MFVRKKKAMRQLRYGARRVRDLSVLHGETRSLSVDAKWCPVRKTREIVRKRKSYGGKAHQTSA